MRSVKVERKARGNPRTNVARVVIGSSLKMTLLGAALGVAGALGVSRLVGALLFGVSPTDPRTYGAVVVLILVVGVLASWMPARRATSIDPASALRSE